MNPLEYIMFSIFRLLRQLRLRRIIRLGTSTRKFTDYFKGFEKVEAVKRIFGEKTEEVLHNLKIEFRRFGGYMGVDDATGNLMVNPRYLSSGDRVDIYLDVIHELCHVKQFMEGRELFDTRYDYVDRPTEVEAYRYTVQEARRIGLSDKRICEYLKTEWMSEDDFKRLAKTVNVSCC
jgi:predicted SprT family Zn-dependent metalloprotease